ncbi:hypothetical protein EES41_39390 (plasmid) [Streptomyces sp. ADI95-16]|nr:hypothetical protein EES41_39390 [Streptomyces sp. ADI95-16]
MSREIRRDRCGWRTRMGAATERQHPLGNGAIGLQRGHNLFTHCRRDIPGRAAIAFLTKTSWSAASRSRRPGGRSGCAAPASRTSESGSAASSGVGTAYATAAARVAGSASSPGRRSGGGANARTLSLRMPGSASVSNILRTLSGASRQRWMADDRTLTSESAARSSSNSAGRCSFIARNDRTEGSGSAARRASNPRCSSLTLAATAHRTDGSGCSAKRALIREGTEEFAARVRTEPRSMISAISSSVRSRRNNATERRAPGCWSKRRTGSAGRSSWAARALSSASRSMERRVGLGPGRGRPKPICRRSRTPNLSWATQTQVLSASQTSGTGSRR